MSGKPNDWLDSLLARPTVDCLVADREKDRLSDAASSATEPVTFVDASH
jgi:hypothetical protein